MESERLASTRSREIPKTMLGRARHCSSEGSDVFVGAEQTFKSLNTESYELPGSDGGSANGNLGFFDDFRL